MLNHDRDEELSMFLEMRRREKEHRGESLLTGSDGINGALTTAVSAALSGVSETVSSQRYNLRRTAAENFLYSENEKSDYDWLLTPPGTPQFEKESHRSVMNQSDAANSRPTVFKSRLGNCGEEMITKNNNKPQMSSSSVAGVRRPSSSGSSRSTSRPSTPTNRSTSRPSTPTNRSTSRPSTPTRRSTTTTTSTTRPVTTTRASTSRSSTPTSRATLTAARATTTSTAAQRTTTSTGSARSATPTRSKTQPSSAPSRKPLSRPATPTGPSIASTKAPSRGTSPTPTVKSSTPEMPGFSLDAPPNLRTTLPNRPVSASRGRPGVASAPGSRSSSIERSSGGTSGGVVHARRQSCSPSRRQAPIGNTNGSLPGARGRGKANKGGSSSCDSFSPVAMGNKMVERVVNMRKLGPPRLTENGGRGTVKSNSAFNSLGYGRNLSKSSIDMALRHMDIRGGMRGNLRPLVTKVPASSMYSVRSGSTSDTNSPVATSSTMSSSELSVDNMNILCLDGNDAENDDLLSERSYS